MCLWFYKPRSIPTPRVCLITVLAYRRAGPSGARVVHKGWGVLGSLSASPVAPSRAAETVGSHPQGDPFLGCEVAASLLCLRLQQLDEENGELRSCTPCLKANIERLEEVSS